MKQIAIAILALVVINYISKIIKIRKAKVDHIKAGKKWDRIVKELSRRK